MTLIAPPNSLNMLTMVTGGSSPSMIFMQYRAPIGPVFINGTVDAKYQLSDWIHHNANYTVWEFNVQPGLTWSDGTAVNASDILATWGPNFGFNASYDFFGIHTQVKQEYAKNSSDAVFVLNAPDAQWPQKLKGDVYTVAMPASLIKKYGAAAANFGTDKSVGPFYVSNYTAGTFQALMLRNPYFTPKPHICQININFVDSLAQTAAYLQSGSTDFAFVEYSNIKAVLTNPNIKLYDEKGLGITDIQYNDSVFPYNLTAFRQALAWSVNQSQVVKQAFAGYGLTAYNAEGAVSPVATKWFNTNTAQYGFDQQKALSILQTVGMTKGSDNLLHYRNGSVVKLNLWADSDNTADPQAASVVQQNLQALGMQVNLQTTTAGNIVADYGSNKFGITKAMILATVNVAYFGEPFVDTLPGWDVYWLPTVANHHWLWPPNADAQYNSNISAYDNTADPSVYSKYVSNVQALEAKFLPSLVVAYPDKVFAVNTAHWTNYPPGQLIYYSYNWNVTGLAAIKPVNATTSSSSSTSLTGSTSVTTSSATASSTTGPSTILGLDPLVLGGIIAVAILVIAIGAWAASRSRKK
jgi:ABC-type transport system substrate-binding protein